MNSVPSICSTSVTPGASLALGAGESQVHGARFNCSIRHSHVRYFRQLRISLHCHCVRQFGRRRHLHTVLDLTSGGREGLETSSSPQISATRCWLRRLHGKKLARYLGDEEEEIVAFPEEEKEHGDDEVLEDTAEETPAVVVPGGSASSGLPAAPAPVVTTPPRAPLSQRKVVIPALVGRRAFE